MNIAVVGTGYVGLVTAACFAEFGVRVTGVDIDEGKIQALSVISVPVILRDSLWGKSMKSSRPSKS